MILWLVGFGLALICAVNAESECSRDLRQIKGRWCVSAVGSTCEHFHKHHPKSKMIMAEITITKEDKVKVSSTFPTKDGCKKIEKEFDKLEDGTYYSKCEWGEKKMKVVSTDCETYALMDVKIQKKGKSSTVVAMYTKECNKLPDHLKEMFVEYGRSIEVRDDQMIFPTEVACQNDA